MVDSNCKLSFVSVLSVEVTVDEDQWSHQGPHIQRDADPAGGDLHPHRGPLAGHRLIVGVRAIQLTRKTFNSEFKDTFVNLVDYKHLNKNSDNKMADDIVYTNGFIKLVFIKNSFKSLVIFKSLHIGPFTLKRNSGVFKLKWGLPRFQKSPFWWVENTGLV